jgi:hypothetical protein
MRGPNQSPINEIFRQKKLGAEFARASTGRGAAEHYQQPFVPK